MPNEINNIYDYIKAKEAKYKLPVDVINGWSWSMNDHIETSILYKNGRLKTGNSDDKPVKNIVLPILNLEYRSEDIDVKDINLYVDDDEKYFMSFLIKKYHDDVFVVENDIDTFIDKEKEEHIDLGAVLLKDVGEAVPDIVHLQDIAFCDQKDMLSSPIGIKHIFSPSQLKEMEDRGWGDVKNGADCTIDEAIDLLTNEIGNVIDKDIEIYEVNGSLPKSYLTGEYSEKNEYSYQMHIVCFYSNSKGTSEGITLFKKEKENPFKLYKRDDIHNRALGRGGVEELFESQVWATYTQIHKKNMLDAASKIIVQTDDQELSARHPSGLKNLDNLDIITIGEGRKIGQIDTFPRNMQLFDRWDMEWEQHGRTTGAAQEAIMGDEPPAGTPFKSVELQSAESHSLHKYRIGKHAKLLEELYRDLFIPYMKKQIVKGKKFLSTLDLEDMQKIAENLSIKRGNQLIVNKILAGEMINPEEIEIEKQKIKQEFMKDNKKFIEILKDEFKNTPIAIKVNISGKQKNLEKWTDKLVDVFRKVIAVPQVLQQKPFADLFNQILEASGLSPLDFSGFTVPAEQMALPQRQMEQPAMQPPMANQQL
jgi:hypothetical protein